MAICRVKPNISRPNRREWIETSCGTSLNNSIGRISRPNRREWIETPEVAGMLDLLGVSPGLIAGSGLKRYCSRAF